MGNKGRLVGATLLAICPIWPHAGSFIGVQIQMGRYKLAVEYSRSPQDLILLIIPTKKRKAITVLPRSEVAAFPSKAIADGRPNQPFDTWSVEGPIKSARVAHLRVARLVGIGPSSRPKSTPWAAPARRRHQAGRPRSGICPR